MDEDTRLRVETSAADQVDPHLGILPRHDIHGDLRLLERGAGVHAYPVATRAEVSDHEATRAREAPPERIQSDATQGPTTLERLPPGSRNTSTRARVVGSSERVFTSRRMCEAGASVTSCVVVSPSRITTRRRSGLP